VPFVIDNLRLRELASVVQANKPYFDEFVGVLRQQGYRDIFDFVSKPDETKARAVLTLLLTRQFAAPLFDGILRPYDSPTANWYFLAWLFRDAPAQRLGPMVAEQQGGSPLEKRVSLLNHIRQFVRPLFPERESWAWAALSEVMLARLEGSRRALKGTLFEALVRRLLKEVVSDAGLSLEIGDGEVRIHDETYDVQVMGREGNLLIPVKTRETMGGGHALLFTRDIDKSIRVAVENGYRCLPVVIAESWGGDLGSLASKEFVYIQANPNQVAVLEPRLREELRKFVPLLRSLA